VGHDGAGRSGTGTARLPRSSHPRQPCRHLCGPSSHGWTVPRTALAGCKKRGGVRGRPRRRAGWASRPSGRAGRAWPRRARGTRRRFPMRAGGRAAAPRSARVVAPPLPAGGAGRVLPPPPRGSHRLSVAASVPAALPAMRRRTIGQPAACTRHAVLPGARDAVPYRPSDGLAPRLASRTPPMPCEAPSCHARTAGRRASTAAGGGSRAAPTFGCCTPRRHRHLPARSMASRSRDPSGPRRHPRPAPATPTTQDRLICRRPRPRQGPEDRQRNSRAPAS
jgi:hypothetical protein